MDRFSKLHPVAQLVFFAVSFIIPLSFNNPFISVISLICAIFYSKSKVKTAVFSLALIALIGVFNMFFVHYGMTVLFTLKSFDFTLESLVYGFNQGVIFSSVIIWFTALGRCLDSERIIYLFRFAPKTALIFSMVLGFIPRFLKKLSDIRDAQLALNGGNAPKNKLKNALQNLSALISYSLESSIITADSMNARGFKQAKIRKGRYQFTVSDIMLSAFIIVLSAFIFIQKARGYLTFSFEPRLSIDTISISALACFLLIELIPTALYLWENIQWKLSSVKA